MGPAILAALVTSVFFTSFLSGIFGMAGGLILLWILFLLMPVTTAIVVHGLIQMVANGSRAWFSRAHIDYGILANLGLGVVVAAFIFLLVDYKPDLMIVQIIIGLLPILVWLPVSRLALDASRPMHAFICGLVSGGLMISVGIAGPTVDIFFIRTEMDRRAIIATKAAIQLLSHGAKVLFYWQSALILTGAEWIAIGAAIPVAILGTRAGNIILQRLTNAGFRKWTRLIVTGVGSVYLVQGLLKLF